MNTTTENNAQPYNPASQQPDWATHTGEVIIPIIEETVQVGKQVVETAKVRIVKTVHQEEQLVDLPLSHEEFKVERIAVNEYVDTPPSVRYEGDTTVFPVLKEVLVIEKKLVLVEEVHVTRRLVTASEPQRVMTQKEEIKVERITPDPERPGF